MSRSKTTKRILLTGFMGTGKTEVGRCLAEKLGWPFVDLDARIVERAGRSISTLFAEAGEATFRALEKELLQEVLTSSPVVIATGGGAILDPESRAQMKAAGYLVALTADPDFIYERLQSDRTRPLLQVADPLAEIQRLIALRQPFYEEADDVLDSSRKEIGALADAILAGYRAWCRTRGQDRT